VTGDGLEQADEGPQCCKSTQHFLNPRMEATQEFVTVTNSYLN